MTERTLRPTAPAVVPIPPILVGSSSLRGSQAGSPIEMEIRIQLSPMQVRLLRSLPIVGKFVRQWDLPVPAGDWRPHPTMSGVEIQFGAA